MAAHNYLNCLKVVSVTEDEFDEHLPAPPSEFCVDDGDEKISHYFSHRFTKLDMSE